MEIQDIFKEEYLKAAKPYLSFLHGAAAITSGIYTYKAISNSIEDILTHQDMALTVDGLYSAIFFSLAIANAYAIYFWNQKNPDDKN